MGLYWTRPHAFINLDSRNRWFMGDVDFSEVMLWKQWLFPYFAEGFGPAEQGQISIAADHFAHQGSHFQTDPVIIRFRRFAAGMAQKNSTGRFSADAVVQDMLFPVFFHFGNEGFILGTLVLRHEYEVIRHDLLK